jgi:hypothetical protein|nr:MAG TPA: Pulmonary surfactant-associated protein D surfactant protein, trimer, ambiguous [Caudoviricetes sp.]
MKILSNKQYSDLTNEIKRLQDTYDQDVKVLMFENKDYELKIDSIHSKLVDIVLTSDIKKDTIIAKLKEIIRFIEKGK